MLLVDEVLLGPEDGQVVLDRPRLVLGVVVDLRHVGLLRLIDRRLRLDVILATTN